MKLAWLTKVPTSAAPLRGDGSSTLLSEVFPTTVSPVDSLQTLKESPTSATQNGGLLGNAWKQMVSSVKNWLPAAKPDTKMVPQSFFGPDQKHLQQQVEAYAESPFEKSLFYMKRSANSYGVSKAWAEGIRSSDPQTRESALALLRSYLTYSGLDTSAEISQHTQMKLLLFMPHLNEGPFTKVMLNEAILSLPIQQALEFSTILTRDFSKLPPLAQAMILKQLMDFWKTRDKATLGTPEANSFKKLLKTLVIGFYATQSEAMDAQLAQQEKIRFGFLKMGPVQEAYQQQLEDIERRYRLKLRQLKKSRFQKVAEAEEEKMRRIELIYDSMESALMSGLTDLEPQLKALMATAG